MNDLAVRLVIGGDASGAKAALSGLEAQMGSLEKASSRLHALGSKLTSFGSGSLATGLLAGGVFAPFVKAFSDAELSATDMQLAFLEAGGKVNGVFDDINAKSQALSDTLPGSKKDTDQTARWLKQLGIAPEVIRDGALEASSSLRVLFKLSNEEAAKTGALMSQAFDLGGSEFTRGADLFQRASFGLGIKADEYAAALANAGSMLKSLNISGYGGMQDTTAMLGMLKRGGISGAEAGTGIKDLLSKAAEFKEKIKKDPGLAAKMRKFDLSDVRFADEKGRIDPKNLAIQLEKFKKLNDDDRSNLLKEIFEEGGAKAAMAIAASGVDGWNEVAKKLAEQATLQARLEKVQNTLSNKWESASGNLGRLAADVGELFEGDLKSGVESIAKMAESASDFLKNHKQAAKHIGYAVAGFAALKIGAGVLSLALGTVLGGFGKALSGFSKAKIVTGWAFDRLRGKKPGGLDERLGAGKKDGLGDRLKKHGAQPVRIVNWHEAGSLGGSLGSGFDGGGAHAKGAGKAEAKPGFGSRLRGRFGSLAKMTGLALGAGAVSGAVPGALSDSWGGKALSAIETVAPLLSGMGGVFGKLARPLSMVSDLFSLGSAAAKGDVEGVGASSGSLAGSLAGAAAGAAIGSIVPVVGTALGGLAGGILGGMGGEALGGWFGRLLKKDPPLPSATLPSASEIKAPPAIMAAAAPAPRPLSVDSHISIALHGVDTSNANEVARAVKDQSERIVQMVLDSIARQKQLSF